MNVIDAYCVDQALHDGLIMLNNQGIREETRNGPAMVMPNPVVTVNNMPMRRVSFSPARDANPFFHLMEALWMLAGRRDCKWLDQFVADFSERFGEQTPQGTYQHGAYGFRWRQHFDLEGGGHRNLPDQLETVVQLLSVNPFDRRVVIAMWDPVADLGASVKDVPCNTHIYPRLRKEVANPLYNSTSFDPITRPVLDLTVCCRSNDAIWGAHGANAVHFSVLQEYLAARLNVGMGKLYQLSNNYHGYLSSMEPIYEKIKGELHDDYQRIPTLPIVTVPEAFDRDLARFFLDDWDSFDGWGGSEAEHYQNAFFKRAAVPMRKAYALWREGKRDQARLVVQRMYYCDWAVAAGEWFDRRWAKAQGLKAEA